jgi:hypothetical protein
MGMGPIECFLGFSVTYTNAFSEHLERRSRELERHHREANVDFMLALNVLHDAVDAALARDGEGSLTAMARGLELLRSCNDHLTSIGEALVRTRAELYERESVDGDDPLIARERWFAAIDCDAMYRELAARGAALPQRLFWDDVAARMHDGGARAGLRLLDRHLRELQSGLRTFAGEVDSMRRLPAPEMAPALHGVSRGVATVTMGFTRFLTAITYFSMLCERASQLYEINTSEATAAIAAAS